MFRPLLIAAALAATLSGCGQMEFLPETPVQQEAMSKAQNPFMGLTRVTVRRGAPSDWYAKSTRQYLEAYTPYGGKIWLRDTTRGLKVDHNTQEMTNVRKLQQLLDALKVARNEMDPAQAAQVDPFIRMLTRSLPY